RRDLHRVERIDADVDQVVDEVVRRAAAVEQRLGPGLGLQRLDNPLVSRLDVAGVNPFGVEQRV
ncbi:MAG: hypothetical protein ACR2RL_06460, partial [Gammaproteobacteria bacterium]